MRSPTKPSRPRSNDSLSIELGRWFKAYATGKGVIAIPIVVGVLAAAELARIFLA